MQNAYLIHNNSPLYCQLEVSKGDPYGLDHAVHAVDLLSEEDVHWLLFAHFSQSVPDLVGVIIGGTLGHEILCHPVHHRLSGLAATARAVFGLDVQNRVQNGLGTLALISVN